VIATALDHAGVAVRDLDTAAAAWQALGFQVTPTAPHLPGGVTGNRCVMFARGYVELLAVIDKAGHSATLARFLARYEGIHVLSLATSDAEAAGRRLGREVIRSARETDGGTARFARVALTELEPRVQLIQHLTPDLVWQAPQMVHANGAQALEAIVMTAANPAAAAADLSRAAGVPVVPDPAGGFALRLARGEVRVLADLGAVFPGLASPSLPFVAGIVVRTADPAQAGRVATASGVAIRFTA
jgi:hypothetical protein